MSSPVETVPSGSAKTFQEIFEIVAETLADECQVPREKITLDSHAVDDLGLDSISFLELCFALDAKLDIQVPYEELVNGINSGKLDPKKEFVIRSFVSLIEKLVQQQSVNA